MKTTPVVNNLAQTLESLSGESKPYVAMFHGLHALPHQALKLMEGFEEVGQLLSAYPQLGARTITDILTSADETQLNAYPRLQKGKELVLAFKTILEKNFKSYVDARLNQGHGLGEAQVLGIQEFLGSSGFWNEVEVKDVFKSEVSDMEAQRVLYAFKTATRLIPNKYKHKIPPVTLVIRGLNPSQHAFASNENNTIVLTVRESLVVQISEALHEYCHLVEKANPELLKKAHQLIESRKISNQTVTMEKFATHYNKPFEEGKTVIYPTDLITPYAGRVYGELDPENPTLGTEVFSVGIEALFLNPTVFYLRDPEHFELISQFLKAAL